MSSTSQLSSFAGRLRRRMLTLPVAAEPSGALETAECACPNRLDFNRLALELFALQFEHNASYRQWCEARGGRPDTVANWTEIPAAPTAAFKEFELSCLPTAERTAVFHSSGTTRQQPSRHYHSAESLFLYETALVRWFDAHFRVPMTTSRLAILTPPPVQAPHSSLVHMFETLRRRVTSDASSFYGQVDKEAAWALDLTAMVECLRHSIAVGQPLLLLGTAFSYLDLLDHLARCDLRFRLPGGSCVLETGGYKGRSRSLPKAALHALISQRLGISANRIICEYGMSELSSQAYDLAIGENPVLVPGDWERTFHFPPWARVQVISPETGDEVPEGETGLLRVFDLANVYSVLAIQTEDLGIRRGNGFKLLGRAVAAEPRGCSLMAV